jgi:hypothetical protein
MDKGQGRLLRKDADDADEAEVAEVAERKRGNDNLVQKTCRNLFIQRQRRLKDGLSSYKLARLLHKHIIQENYPRYSRLLRLFDQRTKAKA